MQIVQNKQQQQQQFFQQQPFQSTPPPPSQQQSPLFQNLQQNMPVQNFIKNQQTNMVQTSGSFLFTNQNTMNQNSKPNLFSQLIGTSQPAMTKNKFSLDIKTTPMNTFMNVNNFSMNNSMNAPATNLQTPLNAVTNRLANTGPSLIYSSKNDDLTAQDIEEFKANKFTLGKIPHLPPAEEFCFL